MIDSRVTYRTLNSCFFSLLINLLALTVSAVAQTASLGLGSTTIVPGSSASLDLSLSGSSGPASLQWTLTYPSSSVSAFSITPGASLSGAGKSLSCSAGAGNLDCVAVGLNAATIANGVIATVAITPSISSGTISIGVINPVAASSTGLSSAASASGGTLTVGSLSTLSSFSCSPSSITTPGTSSCTVTLTGVAPSGGTTVALLSNNSNLTVPSSVVVAAGSSSIAFTANASSVSALGTPMVTATLGGAALQASLTLNPPAPAAPLVVPSSLACMPSSLAPAGSSICTLILTGLAPPGGAAVGLTSSSSSLAIPASVIVPAGSSSTTFNATAAAVTAAQTSVVTASLGGSSLTNSVVLNPAAGPAVLMVGPGQTYTSPCAALTAAADGSTIKIDAAGTYPGDVCTITASEITVKGINGRPVINAAGLNSGGAAWLFHGNNITVDTVELTGAAGTGNNAAAILMTGANLSVLNSYIHDNQDGLQTAANAASQILVQASELNHNGFGDGLTHNVDVNTAARFTMQYSYSHNANAGDLVKTQAAENYILFNRLTSEQGTTASEMDLRGGRSFLIGNLIEKGPNDTGSNVVGYLAGNTNSANPSTELYVVNNTLVNDQSASANFLSIGSADPTPAIVTNNIFYGAGVFSTQTNSVLTANSTANPLFVNQAAYDYHLTSSSPAINAGAAAGSADGVSLVPGYQYLDPSCGQLRTTAGTSIDVGAYEYGGAGASLYCALAAAGINLNPSTVTGGAVTTSNTVTLSVPAPSTGTVVTLASSNASAAAVPATITVPAGAMSGAFSITTSPVAASTPVTVSAAYSGSSQTATLTILPPAGVSAVQCAPSSLSSGAVSTCTVTLTSAAPSGGAAVNLASSTSLLSVPASLSIPAGSLATTFSATAGSIVTTQSATISASLNGISKSITLNLLGPSSLVSFTCRPTSLRSYSTSNCVVTLTSAAPSTGVSIAVSSSSGMLTVPASVTIPAGSASASFAARTGRVWGSRSATVTAKLGSTSLGVKFSLSH